MVGSGHCNITMIRARCDLNILLPFAPLSNVPHAAPTTAARALSCTLAVTLAARASKQALPWLFKMQSHAQVQGPSCPLNFPFFIKWSMSRRFWSMEKEGGVTCWLSRSHVSRSWRHEGDSVRLVKDVLFLLLRFFAQRVNAKWLMFARNLMHNDKVTAAGLQKTKKPPHYCVHFITSQQLPSFLSSSRPTLESAPHFASCSSFSALISLRNTYLNIVYHRLSRRGNAIASPATTHTQ